MNNQDIETYLTDNKYLGYIEDNILNVCLPITKTIKLPKNQDLINIEWLENKLNTTTEFKNLKKYIKLNINDINVYVASYGIGIFLFSRNQDQINSIKTLLNKKDIKYICEYSNKFYVYRFLISKRRDNLKKLKYL